MLLFDPTRGIDVGTKHQVYDLIGQLADEGAAVVMFTSELREIGLVCDRAAVPNGWSAIAPQPNRSSRASARCAVEVRVLVPPRLEGGVLRGHHHVEGSDRRPQEVRERR